MSEVYKRAENEVPKRATYFVSFWWSILWKELAALAVSVLFWQVGTAFFSDHVVWRIILLLIILCGLFYFFKELFYAQLEKRYLRKHVTMLPVDKDGVFVEPRMEHARALLWSFLWGHISLLLYVALFYGFLYFFFWIWGEVDNFLVSLISLYISLFSQEESLILWALIFAFYPHYWVWSRSFYNLAGFRLALVR